MSLLNNTIIIENFSLYLCLNEYHLIYQAGIEHALDKVCHTLPRSLHEQCSDLVKIYSKELVQLLLSDMTPQEVCAYLKMCDSAKNVDDKSKPTAEKKIIAVPRNDVEGKQACALCQYVLHYIQQAITDPKAEVNLGLYTLYTMCILICGDLMQYSNVVG